VIKIFFVAIALLSLQSTNLFASEQSYHGPIALRSQNPVYLLFLSPRSEPARVLPAGSLKLSAQGPYSNIFEEGMNPTSGLNVDLDMELFRPAFLLQWGFAPQWEFGLELPFLHFEGGFLDAFVQGYHNAFGFPNGGRDTVSNGRFEYRFSTYGQDRYRVGTEMLQPSDLILHVKRQWLTNQNAWLDLATTLYLKIPTGKKSEGLGSGSPDLGINLAIAKHYKRLHVYANLGGVLLGATDLGFEEWLNTWLWSWMSAMEVTLWSHHLSGLAQVQGDGSLFDGTGIDVLDQGNLILTIGFAGQEGPWGWKVAFAEDPSGQGPAVDFTSYLEVSYTWNFTD